MSFSIPVTSLAMANDYTTLRADNYISPMVLMNQIAIILDNDFQNGTIVPAGVDITPPAGTLQFTSPMSIGQDIADYWSAAIGLGIPKDCSQVVSVSNDAQKIAIPLEQALINLSGQLFPETTEYEQFVSTVYSYVNTIIWTINEADGTGCSSTYTTTIV